MTQKFDNQARQRRHIALQQLHCRKLRGEQVGRTKTLPKLAESYVDAIASRSKASMLSARAA